MEKKTLYLSEVRCDKLTSKLVYFPGVLGRFGNRRGLSVPEKCKTLTDLSLVSPGTAFAWQLFKSDQTKAASLLNWEQLPEQSHPKVRTPGQLQLIYILLPCPHLPPHTLMFPLASVINLLKFSVNSYLDFFTLFLHLLCIFDNGDVAFVHFVVSSVPQPVLVPLVTQKRATNS